MSMTTKNAGLNRLKKELMQLDRDPPPGIICYQKDDNDMTQLESYISGPPESPYQAGRFRLDLQIPEKYPFDPPQIRFHTKIYHPNIDDGGRICADILKKGKWAPSMSIASTLMSLAQLMAHPNPDDPLDADIAKQFQLDYPGFLKKAKEWTNKYASEQAHEEDDEEEEEEDKEEEEEEEGEEDDNNEKEVKNQEDKPVISKRIYSLSIKKKNVESPSSSGKQSEINKKLKIATEKLKLLSNNNSTQDKENQGEKEKEGKEDHEDIDEIDDEEEEEDDDDDEDKMEVDGEISNKPETSKNTLKRKTSLDRRYKKGTVASKYTFSLDEKNEEKNRINRTEKGEMIINNTKKKQNKKEEENKKEVVVAEKKEEEKKKRRKKVAVVEKKEEAMVSEKEKATAIQNKEEVIVSEKGKATAIPNKEEIIAIQKKEEAIVTKKQKVMAINKTSKTPPSSPSTRREVKKQDKVSDHSGTSSQYFTNTEKSVIPNDGNHIEHDTIDLLSSQESCADNTMEEKKMELEVEVEKMDIEKPFIPGKSTGEAKGKSKKVSTSRQNSKEKKTQKAGDTNNGDSKRPASKRQQSAKVGRGGGSLEPAKTDEEANNPIPSHRTPNDDDVPQSNTRRRNSQVTIIDLEHVEELDSQAISSSYFYHGPTNSKLIVIDGEKEEEETRPIKRKKLMLSLSKNKTK